LVRNSVVLAVYLLFSVACFFTVHEHSGEAYNSRFANAVSNKVDHLHHKKRANHIS